MTQLNPIMGNPAQSSAAQRLHADDKAAQMRREELARRGATADSFESQIQDLDQVEPASDQSHRKQPREQRKKRKPNQPPDDGEKSGLDIRA